MIKQIATTGVLVLLITFLLVACASTTSETLSDPSSSSGASVPGEKTSDEERYAPGPMGSGNVKW